MKMIEVRDGDSEMGGTEADLLSAERDGDSKMGGTEGDLPFAEGDGRMASDAGDDIQSDRTSVAQDPVRSLLL